MSANDTYRELVLRGWERLSGEEQDKLIASGWHPPGDKPPLTHTPYLDSLGISFKPDVPAHAVNIIDHLLAEANRQIDWGEYQGRKRKPCPEQPLLLTGMPIGQYHCPVCGMMLLAAMPHISPRRPPDHDPEYPLDDYEDEYGRPWPPGYEDD
jgi:hypothetical protein